MSTRMKPGDPASWMLFDGVETTPVTYLASCYICNDPEFALMGLPLCRECPMCEGHIPADDSVCDYCGYDEYGEEVGYDQALQGKAQSPVPDVP